MSLFWLAFQKPQHRGWAEPRPGRPRPTDRPHFLSVCLPTHPVLTVRQLGPTQNGSEVWGLMLNLPAPQNLRLQITRSTVPLLMGLKQVAISLRTSACIRTQENSSLKVLFQGFEICAGEGSKWNMQLVLTRPRRFLFVLFRLEMGVSLCSPDLGIFLPQPPICPIGFQTSPLL